MDTNKTTGGITLNSEFLNLGTTDILFQIIICDWREDCPMHWKRFGSIPGFYPLEGSSSLPSCDNQKMSLDIVIYGNVWSRTTALTISFCLLLECILFVLSNSIWWLYPIGTLQRMYPCEHFWIWPFNPKHAESFNIVSKWEDKISFSFCVYPLGFSNITFVRSYKIMYAKVHCGRS